MLANQAMMLGSARFINSIDSDLVPRVVVDGVVVPFSSSVKLLGVIITPTF